MSLLKVMSVVGVRPQIIKAAPLIRLLNANPKIELQLLHTGQHYDYEMSRVFFKDFNLPRPKINLGVGSGTHAEQTAAMMIGVEKAILRWKPDVVIVFGDANTALSGALASTKLRIPTVHVESGLRSGDLNMPEEINRILVDHCADLLFAPTKLAAQNLRNEGIRTQSIYHLGDTMMDAIVCWRKSIESSRILDRLGLKDESYAVLTTHRVENVDNPQRLSQILSAVMKIGTPTIFPVHPRTRRNFRRFGFWSKRSSYENIRPVSPLDYIDMLRLVKSSRLLLTDSGGMQKEAFLLRVPCLTLRNRTEWVETVTLGANRLVGACKLRILREAKRILASKDERIRLAKLKNPYGDGRAAERMVSILLRVFR